MSSESRRSKGNNRIAKYARILRAAYFSGLVLTAGIMTELLLYSQNYLILNKNWIASKAVGEIPVVAFNETLATRYTIAGNKLNLGAWYGFQEFLLEKPLYVKELIFKFEIPPDSYLDIIFNKTANKSNGFRMSRRKDVSSMFYESDDLRKFHNAKNFALMSLGDGAHIATLRSSAQGNLLSVDRQEPIVVGPGFSFGQIGFRSGMLGAKIDEVEITTNEGVVVHDFRNRRDFLKVFGIHLLIIFLIFETYFFLRGARKRKPKFPVIEMKTTGVYVFCVITTLVYLFDFYYWSRFPFRIDFRILNTNTVYSETLIEEFRHRMFLRWATVMGIQKDLKQEMLAAYGKKSYSGPVFCSINGCRGFLMNDKTTWGERNTNCRLVAYVGGSQTFGEGAEGKSNLFFERIQRDLNRVGSKDCLESINFGRSGFDLIKHQEILTSGILEKFPPDLVIFDISNNDTVDTLNTLLPIFISRFKELGSRIILLEEPNAVENEERLVHIRRNHEILRTIGQNEGVPVLKLHEFLARAENRKSGVLWWDHVHLAPYGHFLFAEWLKPFVLQQLKEHSRPPGKLTSL